MERRSLVLVLPYRAKETRVRRGAGAWAAMALGRVRKKKKLELTCGSRSTERVSERKRRADRTCG